MSEPIIVVENREQLIYLLTEAAEIEHGLMCCYIYAAASLRCGDPALTDEQRAAVGRWRGAILGLAREEMVHLALVGNLLSALGSAPHFARRNFPVSSGYHPAGIVVSLAPFDTATLDHFVYLERPEGVELPDGRGFAPRAYHRAQGSGRLVPSAQDYATVGHLYRGIREALAALSARLGERTLFVGDPRVQVGFDLFSLPGVAKVTSLAEAEAAIDTIVRQGEGAQMSDDTSHYRRFLQIRDEYADLLARDPRFVPARPAARNPVMRRPPEPAGKVWIAAEPAASVLDTANAAYALMLRALGAMFSPIAVDSDVRPVLADLTVVAMQVLSPLCVQLTELPASPDHPDVTAGMTFTMSRSIHPPPDDHALRLIAEVARDVGDAVRRHARLDDSLVAALAGLATKIDELSRRERTTPAAAPPAPPPPAPPPSVPAAGGAEVVPGTKLSIVFDGKRCIHSRHCVLDAPGVFRANTPGAWIHPDAASVETLVGVAHNCPSGAIRYLRHDGGPEETAAVVNVCRLRENGPLAVHATIQLAGHGAMLRATLCRCGQSGNKPFCDGSHAAAGFAATGEPATVTTDALAARDGTLVVTPRKNGPLSITGNLEICAGTGRIVSRVVKTALCRCGGSSNKPFCDGTHARNGFIADGE
jgi:CDGSH-type Zn-finger protein/uncharacterized Fe-S cluster protein YjdI